MGTSDAEAADVYEEALTVLRCFAPEDEVTTRLQFKRRHQSTEEFTIDLKDLQRLANACGFGAATNIMLKGKVFGGLLSNQLRRKFIQMGNNFTFKKAMGVAKEEEHTNRLIQQLCILHVDAVTQQQEPQHGQRDERRRDATSKMAAFLPSLAKGKMAARSTEQHDDGTAAVGPSASNWSTSFSCYRNPSRRAASANCPPSPSASSRRWMIWGGGWVIL